MNNQDFSHTIVRAKRKQSALQSSMIMVVTLSATMAVGISSVVF